MCPMWVYRTKKKVLLTHQWIIVFRQRSLNANRKRDGVRKEEEMGVGGGES